MGKTGNEAGVAHPPTSKQHPTPLTGLGELLERLAGAAANLRLGRAQRKHKCAWVIDGQVDLLELLARPAGSEEEENEGEWWW